MHLTIRFPDYDDEHSDWVHYIVEVPKFNASYKFRIKFWAKPDFHEERIIGTGRTTEWEDPILYKCFDVKDDSSRVTGLSIECEFKYH
jgi:hypothetical protein